MKFVYFTHSLASCWNHGNAHFLRGVLRELVHRGHDVEAYEPTGAWSLANLMKDHGDEGLDAYRSRYHELSSRTFEPTIDLGEAILRRYAYWLKVEVVATSPGGAGLDALTVETDFQHAPRTLAWLGHLRIRHYSFWIALALSWGIVLPEYLLNVGATRWGYGTYTGAQMAAFHLCAGVVCVALVSRFVLHETLSGMQLGGFAL